MSRSVATVCASPIRRLLETLTDNGAPLGVDDIMFMWNDVQMNTGVNGEPMEVDTAGNQLPYIDRMRFQVLADQESAILKGIAGEVDLAERNFQVLETCRC